MTTEICPVCHSEKTKFLFEGYDYWLGHPDSALVYSCSDCEHVFVAGELTPEQLTDMYTNYYPRSNFNVDDYKPYKEKNGFLYWLDGEEGLAYRHVPKNVRVLDIGCGYCESLGYHKARGCEVYGVEADENAKIIADKHEFHVKIGLFDPKDYEPCFFDYVTMDQVLEHAVDPLKTLADIDSILKPGGRFVVSVPNPHAFGRRFFGKYWLCWHLPFHRHFFSKKSVAEMAKQTGFVVDKMYSATRSNILLGNWGQIVARLTRNKSSALRCVSEGHFDPETANRFDVSTYIFLKKLRFMCLSMRIADILGVGDWNLIVLRKA
ncbi:MAG: class I SAM-dependent methyltransferase [Thermoguttaceae bacterium]